jgi:hypothetical protein
MTLQETQRKTVHIHHPVREFIGRRGVRERRTKRISTYSAFGVDMLQPYTKMNYIFFKSSEIYTQ